GHIEFIGRNDFQVKLNGYRVELDEIAAKLTRLPGVDRAVARIQQGDKHDRLVGYLVPSADYTPLTGAGDPQLDKQAFLMSGHGVLEGTAPGTPLVPRTDPAAYTRAKSYRHFLPEDIDPALPRKHFAEVLATATPAPNGTGGRAGLGVEDWTAVLEQLSAVSLPDRALPKYRYPSAGSTYPVRTFVKLSGRTEGLGSGHFSYHPPTGELRPHGLDAVAAFSAAGAAEGAEGGAGDEIQLVAYWPAITPLYGDQARRLALLEAGHMLALLTDVLDARRIPYTVELADRELDGDHTAVCRIVLGTSGGFEPSQLGLACFLREAGAVDYTEHEGSRRYAAGDLPVFDRASDVWAVLRRARCLLALEGGEGAAEAVSAGFLFQRLSERLRAEGLGTCPLGLQLTDRGVYTMAVGAVDEQARAASDSPADPPTLTAAVTEELAKALPEYMLPSGYGVLDALPLSANGKLAADRLPPVEFAGVHVAPATETERALAAAWADILGRPAEAISTNDSFFSVGGNSLAAMKLVRLLQQDLGFELKLRDLYRNDTILKLAEHVGTALTDAVREEGEL
ncbi:phosphopantetheine-binding protein, partial [Streptomyces morookaense]